VGLDFDSDFDPDTDIGQDYHTIRKLR